MLFAIGTGGHSRQGGKEGREVRDGRNLTIAQLHCNEEMKRHSFSEIGEIVRRPSSLTLESKRENSTVML
jgi:hypothetical protein